MKKLDMVTQTRIKNFMAEKSRKYPELNEVQPRKIPVYQRGRVLDEINFFFGARKLGA